MNLGCSKNRIVLKQLQPIVAETDGDDVDLHCPVVGNKH